VGRAQPLDADCSIKGNDLDKDGLPDDTDGDGLLDCEERFLGTSKDLIDTDADGIPDGVEVKFGTNPGAVDVEDDLDFDGMPNGDEIRLHTDPGSDDAVHRSRVSYRYNVRQVGTGVETVGYRCLKNEDCPTKADCKDGYCRCFTDDACSSQAACKQDIECLVPGELCDTGKCKGKWTCQAPTETMKGPENVCAARKNISCYQYDVENIALVTPKPPEGGQVGWNQINLIFGEVPFDNPMDFGNFSMACVRAWYQSADGGKLPATGSSRCPRSPGTTRRTSPRATRPRRRTRGRGRWPAARGRAATSTAIRATRASAQPCGAAVSSAACAPTARSASARRRTSRWRRAWKSRA